MSPVGHSMVGHGLSIEQIVVTTVNHPAIQATVQLHRRRQRAATRAGVMPIAHAETARVVGSRLGYDAELSVTLGVFFGRIVAPSIGGAWFLFASRSFIRRHL